MKYNRINIKWLLVSTSSKIYLDILSSCTSRSRSFIRTLFHSSVQNEQIYSTLSEQFQDSIVVIGKDCTGSCKFNYHTTTAAQVRLSQPHLKYTLTFFHLVHHVHDLLLEHYFTQVYIFFLF
jgi:hypothetical protein